MTYSGELFIERIEQEARVNPDFRRMLQGVWKSGIPEIWSRLEVARGSAGNAV